MGWESSDVVRFDLGPLLQGQMRIPKLKSAYTINDLFSPQCAKERLFFCQNLVGKFPF